MSATASLPLWQYSFAPMTGDTYAPFEPPFAVYVSVWRGDNYTLVDWRAAHLRDAIRRLNTALRNA